MPLAEIFSLASSALKTGPPGVSTVLFNLLFALLLFTPQPQHPQRGGSCPASLGFLGFFIFNPKSRSKKLGPLRFLTHPPGTPGLTDRGFHLI